MYIFDVSFENNSKVGSEIINKLKTINPLNSYNIYGALIDFLIRNADNNDEEYSFIHQQISYLFIDNPNNIPLKKISISLNDKGKNFFIKELFDKKRLALNNYLNLFLTNPINQQKIVEVYNNDGQILKSNPPNNIVLNNDLQGIAQNILNPPPPQVISLNEITILNTNISKILNKKPFIVQGVTALMEQPPKQINQNTINNIQQLLSNANIHLDYRKAFIGFIVDEMAGRCRSSKEAMSQKANKTRLSEILKALPSNNIKNAIGNLKLKNVLPQNFPDISVNIPSEILPGSMEFQQALLITKATFDELIQANNLQVNHLSPKLFFTNKEDILIPAGLKFISFIKSIIGFNDLEISLLSEFDPFKETADLIELTFSLANDVINKIRLKIANQDAGNKITPLPEFNQLKLHTFYSFSDYMSAMSRLRAPAVIDDNKAFAQTFFNSIDTPLVRLESDGLYFYNCQNYLYLNDLQKPQIVYFSNKNISLIKDPNDNNQIQKIKSNWTNRTFGFNFLKPYEALYLCNANEILSHLMWQKTSGGGNGIGRADEIQASEYIWGFDGDLKYFQAWFNSINYKPNKTVNDQVVGAFLGLESKNYRPLHYLTQQKIEIEAPDSKINYVFIKDDTQNTTDSEYYIQCNTPFLSTIAKNALNQTIPSHPDSKGHPLSHFQILYFRRVGFGGTDLLTKKVIKRGPVKNRPKKLDAPTHLRNDLENFIGIDLPFCFNIEKNNVRFHGLKKNWGVIKNKGNWLTSNPNFRKDAGKVMGAISAYSNVIPRSNVLSANQMSKYIIPRPKAKKDWNTIKLTDASLFPADQEWCHLQGHGDGGDERVGNFVCGSKHCNTEQLAIESGQRKTTQANKGFILKSTAYLMDDDSMISNNNSNYLISNDKSYLQNAYILDLSGNKGLAQNIVQSKFDQDLNKTVNKAPIANFIRYKIYYKPDNQPSVKVFDYLFEGQSEFFDKNQYIILNSIIRYLLDPINFFTELAEFVENP